MKRINLTFVFLFFLFKLVFSQSDFVEIPLVFQNRCEIIRPMTSENYFTFFKAGKVVAKEEFQYIPFTLTFNKRCLEYFENHEADFKDIKQFLLVAGEIGSIFKKGPL